MQSTALKSMLGAAAVVLLAMQPAWAQSPAPAEKPNILVIWGDDIGITNISYNNKGLMGYQTPNIDRIAKEGLSFTDYYGQQSCTAGRAAFIGGNNPMRTGMTCAGPANPGRAGQGMATGGAGCHAIPVFVHKTRGGWHYDECSRT